jgi:hypothetical protein
MPRILSCLGDDESVLCKKVKGERALVYLSELDYRLKSFVVLCHPDGYEYATSSKKADLEA